VRITAGVRLSAAIAAALVIVTISRDWGTRFGAFLVGAYLSYRLGYEESTRRSREERADLAAPVYDDSTGGFIEPSHKTGRIVACHGCGKRIRTLRIAYVKIPCPECGRKFWA